MIPNRSDKKKITGLLIAAGLSSRMGQFKPLIKWNGKTFLSNIVDKLKPICDNIVIITGNESKTIEDYIDENYDSEHMAIRCVHNPSYLEGMFTSLKKGIENCKEADWILYHQVDQPNLTQEFYNTFIEQTNNKYDWIQPTFEGRNGHPILIGKNISQKILHAENNTNLRMLSNNSEIKKKYWDCDSPEIFTDIDNKEDLNKLIRENND